MSAADETCVRQVNGDPEAQQLKAFLEVHGIPCVLRGEAVRMTHGFTLDGLGVVRVCVAPDFVGQARELLARVDAGLLTLASDIDVEPA
jgi:hypothetical protein